MDILCISALKMKIWKEDIKTIEIYVLFLLLFYFDLWNVYFRENGRQEIYMFICRAASKSFISITISWQIAKLQEKTVIAPLLTFLQMIVKECIYMSTKIV